ncbi:MAG TPA: hypothetical protein VK700_13820 [Steroidobacteraceae bacterium]|jgi:hypothetical protein|nr:hypothetical protein [Steroidobacteraceae bacterium]
MRDATLVELWSQVSRSFLPRAATPRQTESAQNAFLAGALGVFLHLERAVESGDAAVLAATLKKLRRELNLGMTQRGRSRARRAAARV